MDNAFFIASKVLWLLLQPINVLLWLLVAGTGLLWTRFAKAGRRLVTGVLLVVLILGVMPVNEWLLTLLENRFHVVQELPDEVAGVVVLSGQLNSRISEARGQPALGCDAERLTETLVLMRRFPYARVFFTGFSGSLFPEGPGAAAVARRFFETQGADTGRIHYEMRSRNTYENALYTKRLAHPEPGEVWLLVTSASHMPRSVGVFRKIGWDMVAVPVDFGTDRSYNFSLKWFSIHRVLGFNGAIREWIGLLAYYLTGRSSAFFPTSPPQPAASRQL